MRNASSRRSAAPRRAPDLRREGAVLVPVSLLLLVALAVFTLISYRTSVRLLVEERREEALTSARVLASRLAAAP
ncbi:MAG TPA: hypothetical protein VHQ65_03970, partial [Thermoanaerobaculia bacterium]|nr:hypothetical protein [Thermoanaerobaculia bacterium]